MEEELREIKMEIWNKREITLCVCVCVWGRERDRQTDRLTDR